MLRRQRRIACPVLHELLVYICTGASPTSSAYSPAAAHRPHLPCSPFVIRSILGRHRPLSALRFSACRSLTYRPTNKPRPLEPRPATAAAPKACYPCHPVSPVTASHAPDISCAPRHSHAATARPASPAADHACDPPARSLPPDPARTGGPQLAQRAPFLARHRAAPGRMDWQSYPGSVAAASLPKTGYVPPAQGPASRFLRANFSGSCAPL